MHKLYVIREGIGELGYAVDIAADDDIFEKSRELIQCEWLEPVYSFSNSVPGLVMLVDEDGMMNDCHLANPVASIGAGVPIVGNAVIVRVGADDFEPLTEDDIDNLREYEHTVYNLIGK